MTTPNTKPCLEYHLQLDLKDLATIDTARIQLLKQKGTLLERKQFLEQAVQSYVTQNTPAK